MFRQLVRHLVSLVQWYKAKHTGFKSLKRISGSKKKKNLSFKWEYLKRPPEPEHRNRSRRANRVNDMAGAKDRSRQWGVDTATS